MRELTLCPVEDSDVEKSLLTECSIPKTREKLEKYALRPLQKVVRLGKHSASHLHLVGGEVDAPVVVVALHAAAHHQEIISECGIGQSPVGQNLVAGVRPEVEVKASTYDRETGAVSLVQNQRLSLELYCWSCMK